jgi:DMSO/TMAO reductase YedYZ molybdopterin-dependent catalytic subunit
MNRTPFTRRDLFRLAAATALPVAAEEPLKTAMAILSRRPEDFETPLDAFQSYLTPLDRFFVRSHHYTPRVDLNEWKLEVGGRVGKPMAFTMEELRKLPRVELVSVLECAGNGRGFYEPSMPGLQWKHGAVGNARWAGVRLADVFKAAGGVRPGTIEILFDGADVPVATQPKFVRTIPLKKALEPGTLLAYEMNGQPLPASHGFPLRAVVPGWAGDCWMKWVTRIEARDTEFEGFYMKTAYRHPGHGVRPGTPVDPAKMEPVTRLRVKSVIATPAEGSVVEPGQPLTVRGVAWSDGSPVLGVDVSTNGGRSWRPALFSRESEPFGWRLWSHRFTTPQTGFITLMARARTAQDIQPLAPEWNPSGYGWNVVHAVGVSVGGPPAPAPAAPPDVEMPAGYKGACLTCHGEEVIAQQRLSPAQWAAEVEKMIRWGAPVKPEQKAGILEYLSKRYPYRVR